MVLTILEATVAEDQWKTLQSIYAERTSEIPKSIVQTFLLQSQYEPTAWRIVTHWRSQEDLDAMRASGETPLAVQIFKQVGATPQLGIWEVAVHRQK